jgi:hypothetical protein
MEREKVKKITLHALFGIISTPYPLLANIGKSSNPLYVTQRQKRLREQREVDITNGLNDTANTVCKVIRYYYYFKSNINNRVPALVIEERGV